MTSPRFEVGCDILVQIAFRAKAKIEMQRKEYNAVGLQGSLRYRPPAPQAVEFQPSQF